MWSIKQKESQKHKPNLKKKKEKKKGEA